jgi:hypothetical protein
VCSSDLKIWPRIKNGTRAALIHCYGNPPAENGGGTDPTSPTVGADAGSGDAGWTGAMNICDYNDTVAACVIDGALGQTNSNKIYATQFDWDPPIPDSTEILGIKAEVMRQEINYGGGLQDLNVQLLKAGVETGQNKGTYPWPNDQTFPWAYQTYGNDSDLWNEEWWGEDLNDPDFGLSISCHRTGEHSLDTAQIAHVQLTAYFEQPSGWFTEPTQKNFFMA